MAAIKGNRVDANSQAISASCHLVTVAKRRIADSLDPLDDALNRP
jgi:hypothetical protein